MIMPRPWEMREQLKALCDVTDEDMFENDFYKLFEEQVTTDVCETVEDVRELLEHSDVSFESVRDIYASEFRDWLITQQPADYIVAAKTSIGDIVLEWRDLHPDEKKATEKNE